MKHITATPFGRRAIDLARIRRESEQRAVIHIPRDKWDLLNAFEIAAPEFGLSHRQMNVLRALLSLHGPRVLDSSGSLIVFASNRKIAERAQNMPESTMRRHVACLIDSGFLARHDSANGKRFRTRRDGEAVAFGLDLTPLLARAEEIIAMAAKVTEAEKQRRDLRARLSAMLRDILTLNPDQDLIEVRRSLRRKSPLDVLQGLFERLAALHKALLDRLEPSEKTCVSSSNDARNEQHIQSQHTEEITLHTVLDHCPALLDHLDDTRVDWRNVTDAALRIAPMMGVSREVVTRLTPRVGLQRMAVSICLLLQRFDEVKSPTAYLTWLCEHGRLGKELRKLTAVNSNMKHRLRPSDAIGGW